MWNYSWLFRNVAIFQFEAPMCPARPASRGARRMWHHDWLPILSDQLGHERVQGVLGGGGGGGGFEFEH